MRHVVTFLDAQHLKDKAQINSIGWHPCRGGNSFIAPLNVERNQRQNR